MATWIDTDYWIHDASQDQPALVFRNAEGEPPPIVKPPLVGLWTANQDAPEDRTVWWRGLDESGTWWDERHSEAGTQVAKGTGPGGAAFQGVVHCFYVDSQSQTLTRLVLGGGGPTTTGFEADSVSPAAVFVPHTPSNPAPDRIVIAYGRAGALYAVSYDGQGLNGPWTIATSARTGPALAYDIQTNVLYCAFAYGNDFQLGYATSKDGAGWSAPEPIPDAFTCAAPGAICSTATGFQLLYAGGTTLPARVINASQTGPHGRWALVPLPTAETGSGVAFSYGWAGDGARLFAFYKARHDNGLWYTWTQ
jgi:hypothetical protein